MAKVYIVKTDVPPFKETWSLYRVGTGPGRGEGHGFKTVAAAKRFAKQWKHEVVTLTTQGVR